MKASRAAALLATRQEVRARWVVVMSGGEGEGALALEKEVLH